MAWDLTETPYVYIPWVGGIGSKTKEDLLLMTGQVKFDDVGNPVLMHQMWKDGNNILKHDLIFRRDLRDGVLHGNPYKAESYEIQNMSKKIDKVISEAAEAWNNGSSLSTPRFQNLAS